MIFEDSVGYTLLFTSHQLGSPVSLLETGLPAAVARSSRSQVGRWQRVSWLWKFRCGSPQMLHSFANMGVSENG